MAKHYPPEHEGKSFTCPICDVYAAQSWGVFFFRSNDSWAKEDQLAYCVCAHCHNWSYWHGKKLIIPSSAPVPVAHPDLPKECKSEYDEARSIVASSPRAAAALLRLALQKLMVHLGEKGKNINDDIGSLVAKGLPVQIQQALDFCRVVGNNAVHPLEIQINDTPEIAHTIFSMLNFIVEDRIEKPRQIAAAFDRLPAGAKEAIRKRDGGAASAAPGEVGS